MDMKIAMIFEAMDNASQKMDAMMRRVEGYGQDQISASREQITHHKEARQALAAEAIEVAALGYSFLTLTNAASEFETQMAGVNKVTAFHDQENAIDALSDKILQLSTDIPMSAAEIATLIESAGQAGVVDSSLSDEDQIAAYTRYAELSGQIGTAFDISAAQAGETATLWMKTWGLAEEQVIDLADATNHLSNNLSASAPQILDILQRQGGFVRATTGLAEAEIAALSASFAAASPNAEIAATSMKNFVSAMTEGAAAPKAQIEAFKALGFSATDLAERMQVDAKGAILDVFTAIEGAPDELRSSLLTKAFGQESIGAIATLAANTQTLSESFSLIEHPAERAGSFVAEYLVQAGTTAAQQERFMNSLKQTQILIGTALIPILIDLMEAVAPILQVLTTWVKENPELVAQIAKVVVGLIAMKAATLPLRYAWHLLLGGFAHGRLALGVMITAFGKFGLALSFMSRFLMLSMKGFGLFASTAIWAFRAVMIAARGLALSLAASPIGLIVAAIAASAYLIYQNWEGVLGFFERLWGYVKNVFQGTWDFFAGLFTGDSARMIGGLSTLWNGVKGILTAPFEIAWNTIEAIFAEFGIQLAWDPLAIIEGVWGALETYFKGLWNGISSIVQGVWTFFDGLFTLDSEKMIAGLYEVWDGIQSILTAPFEAAWVLVEGVFKSFDTQFSWSPMETLKSAWGGVSDYIGGLFDGIGTTVSSTWEQVSGFFTWWGDSEGELAKAEAIAELPAKLDAANPQSMITAAEASKQLAQNVAAIEGANLHNLSSDANALATDIADVKGAVLQSLDEIDAALTQTDYSYHGSRLMETLASGILSGRHFVTDAMASALKEAREYLPSSPAKRGPLSDIHRLKFMETIAGSIHAAPLLDAITGATSLARGALNFAPEPIAVETRGGNIGSYPIAAAGGIAPSLGGASLSVKFENHYHGYTDEKLIEAGNSDLVRQLEAWWKQKQNETKRRAY